MVDAEIDDNIQCATNPNSTIHKAPEVEGSHDSVNNIMHTFCVINICGTCAEHSDANYQPSFRCRRKPRSTIR